MHHVVRITVLVEHDARGTGKTEAICPGTSSRPNSSRHFAGIQVLNSSFPLSDHIKRLGVTLDSAWSFYPHVSNIYREACYHVRALWRVRIYGEGGLTPKSRFLPQLLAQDRIAQLLDISSTVCLQYQTSPARPERSCLSVRR